MTLLALLCLWLFAVQPAAADAITAPITFENALGQPMTLQEAVDAAGDSVYMLFDLGTGQEWTTAATSALPENLLVTILSLGGDSASIDELFQPGAVFADLSGGPSAPAVVPEPATLILLSGALVLSFAAYSRARLRNSRLKHPIPKCPVTTN